MTIDNLLSGLTGALVGALIVVVAEQWRWRRENKSGSPAALLRGHQQGLWLNAVVDSTVAALSTMFSQSVWQAEQVRVASRLRGNELNRIATAYFSLANLLSTRPLLGDDAWMKWLTSDDGKKRVTETLDSLAASETILKHAMDEQTWTEKRWLATRRTASRVWNAAALRAKKPLK